MTLPVASRGGSSCPRAWGGVLSALLLALAMLPVPLPLLVFVALVPLWVTLTCVPTVRSGARVGAWFGVAFWLVHLSWMPWVGLRIGAVWPGMAWLGQIAFLGLVSAGMGGAFVLLRRRMGTVAAAVVAWVGREWLRGHLLGPLSFPWSGVALPLARLPSLVQPAAWGGETLLAAGVVAVNALVARAIVLGWGTGPASGDGARSVGQGRARWGSATRPLVAAVAFVALWAGVGSGRRALLESRPGVRARAVLVQPAVPLAEKRGPGAGQAALDALWAGLAAAEEFLGEGGPTLVVLPETHLPFAIEARSVRQVRTRAEEGGLQGRRDSGLGPGPPDPAWPPGLEDELAGWAAGRGVALLVGGHRRTSDGTTNSLLHVGARGVAGAYDKVALVPGVERGPGGLVPGREVQPLEVEGRPGPLICIESAWGSLARRQARAGAGWLLNVTNDAWLGEGAAVGESPAFDQHPWHLVLRSVETGLGALRVGNNGWTGSVDPLGVWRASLDPHRSGVAVASAESLPTDTLFVRVGDAVGPLCLLLLVLGVTLVGSPPTR